jgi:hypothetical protein
VVFGTERACEACKGRGSVLYGTERDLEEVSFYMDARRELLLATGQLR